MTNIFMNKEKAKDILKLIDLTSLNQTDSIRSISNFINKANQGFEDCYPAAVCLYSKYHFLLSDELSLSIKKCVVAGNFPSSQSPLALKLEEIKYLDNQNIDEIDIVIPIGEAIDGNLTEVKNELIAIRKETKKTLKVILETGALKTPELISSIGRIAIDAGADFLKTSTGKFDVGATAEAVDVLTKLIAEEYNSTGKRVGIKISGGIRTLNDAEKYYQIILRNLGPNWLTPELFRIGASSLYNQIIADISND